MKVIAFCAIVIAGSTFTMAVEDVYGWSRVGPQAQAAWNYTQGLGAELIGMDARAEAATEAATEVPDGGISGPDSIGRVSE